MSIRDTILDAYKSLFEGISTTNGYNCDVQKVERKMLFWDTEEAFPVLMVLGGNEEFDDTLGGRVYSTLHVKIRGYSQNTADPETALCNIIDDVITALDSPSNAYAGQTTLVNLTTDEGWFHLQQQGFGMFEMEITVLYTFERGEP